jgi:hypothetical protein
MINVQGNNLILITPYDPAFVAALKQSIPGHGRKYNPGDKTWTVNTQFGPIVKQLILTHFNHQVNIPNPATITEQRILDIRYIGITKDRGGSERAAYGWCSGAWSVIFPETVLRTWFCAGPPVPNEMQTFYAMLGINQGAGSAEIKTAYRRMAKSFHPDVNHEPNATEMFQLIQAAYEVLSNENKRARYDAGLVLEETIKPQEHFKQASLALDGYRSPLRCGLLYGEGYAVLDKFAVSKIIEWTDIVNEQGKTLVTSWKPGADTYVEEWI